MLESQWLACAWGHFVPPSSEKNILKKLKKPEAPTEALDINRPLTRRKWPRSVSFSKNYQSEYSIVPAYDESSGTARPTRRHIPRKLNLQQHRCEHFRSHNCRSRTWLLASWRLITTLIVRELQCLRQRSEFRAVECKKTVYVLHSDMNHGSCAIIQLKGKMVTRNGMSGKLQKPADRLDTYSAVQKRAVYVKQFVFCNNQTSVIQLLLYNAVV